jgi:hypothetical protein
VLYKAQKQGNLPGLADLRVRLDAVALHHRRLVDVQALFMKEMFASKMCTHKHSYSR